MSGFMFRVLFEVLNFINGMQVQQQASKLELLHLDKIHELEEMSVHALLQLALPHLNEKQAINFSKRIKKLVGNPRHMRADEDSLKGDSFEKMCNEITDTLPAHSFSRTAAALLQQQLTLVREKLCQPRRIEGYTHLETWHADFNQSADSLHALLKSKLLLRLQHTPTPISP
jgi:hypothetical protein